MPLNLIRRPRTRKMWPIVRDTLRNAYHRLLLPAVVDKYEKIAGLSKWKNKPVFKLRIKLSQKGLLIEYYADLSHEGSQIFVWVDKGTGLEGPTHSTYEIIPTTTDLLVFTVPYQPVTQPIGGVTRYNVSAPMTTIKTGIVPAHPGIEARDFTGEVLEWMKMRNNTKGFYRITENAYRRGFTKASRQNRHVEDSS